MPGIKEELRCDVREFRVQESTGDGMPTLEGYASVFETLYPIGDWYQEKVQRGAFAESITKDDIRALWNHDSNIVLGRTKSKTLRLSEDEHGLKVEIDLPNTNDAKTLLELIRRGDVDQMSFGFYVLSEDWTKVDGENIRTLLKVQLYDVSPVTFPASPTTEIDEKRSREILERAKENGLITPVKSDGGDDSGQRSGDQWADVLALKQRTLLHGGVS